MSYHMRLKQNNDNKMVKIGRLYANKYVIKIIRHNTTLIKFNINKIYESVNVKSISKVT